MAKSGLFVFHESRVEGFFLYTWFLCILIQSAISCLLSAVFVYSSIPELYSDMNQFMSCLQSNSYIPLDVTNTIWGKKLFSFS